MNDKTRVIEGRTSIIDVANTLSLIISKGYNPTSASDLVRTAFLILANEAIKGEAITFDKTEDALIFMREQGMEQRSKLKRTRGALLKQLHIENISLETQEDAVEKHLKELEGDK